MAVTSPQWMASVRYAVGVLKPERLLLALSRDDYPPRDPTIPYCSVAWVRIEARGMTDWGLTARAEVYPPDNGASVVGPFDLPALLPIELPCLVRVIPVRNTSGGSIVALAVSGAPTVPYVRRHDTVALGGSLELDHWTRAATLYAAGASGRWLDPSGVQLATFPGGGTRSLRPPAAASLQVVGAPSAVLREW